MKSIALAAILAAATAASLPAQAADVGVSIDIGQPGFYGHIEIGDFPAPRVILPEPIIVVPAAVVHAPVYLRVPPGHQKHWDKHCHEYGACSQRVFFVQDDWYTNVYAPAYHAKHGKGGKGKKHGGNGQGKNEGGKGKKHGKD